jgi:26S proteasome regulatory subunit N3
MIVDKEVKINNDQSPQDKTTQPNQSEIYQDYKRTLANIEKALQLKDTRTLHLNYKQINKFRKGFSDEDSSFICDVLLREKFAFSFIGSLQSEQKEIMAKKFLFTEKQVFKLKETLEIFLFNALIIVLKLIDKKLFNEANLTLNYLLNFVNFNDNNSISTTIQYLRSKVFYLISLVAEKSGRYNEIIDDLIQSYRKACLDLDELTQVTLINCIVRYYLKNNAVEQARNFLSKVKFHENVSTHEDSRYLFYLGRIDSIQMNYSDAFKNLTNSLRKAPEKTADGFKIIVQKLLIIVEMLMGDVPDLSTFNSCKFFSSIISYLDLIKAVKKGDLSEFKNVCHKYERVFIKDGNYTLIQRLRQVVLKIGLRKINLSYSRISFDKINEILNPEDPSDIDLILSKVKIPLINFQFN